MLIILDWFNRQIAHITAQNKSKMEHVVIIPGHIQNNASLTLCRSTEKQNKKVVAKEKRDKENQDPKKELVEQYKKLQKTFYLYGK